MILAEVANPPEAGKLADLVASGDRAPMINVYIIKSLNNDFRYIGITNNINRRFKQHNLGLVKSTKNYKPFKLAKKEEFSNYKEARVREILLKSGVGRKLLDEP